MRLSPARLAGIAMMLVVIAAASIYWLRAKAYERQQKAAELTGGDPTRAPEILRQYGCVACHTVRGVAAAGGLLGPDLSDPEKLLTKNPQALIDYIVNPKELNTKTVMPRTGISRAEARDVVAYLFSLR
jgi:cytochrome c